MIESSKQRVACHLQLLQDLSKARPLDVDRREFFCQVEAFAGLVMLDIVPLSGK